MLHIREAVLVEGKYDQIRLRSLLDGLILETNGFGIFRDDALLALLRRLARTQGVLVLTDSDSAGFLIRDYLAGALPEGRVLHAYIPEIAGKEPRKSAPGKEGLLGVEGMDTARLLLALRDAGATVWEDEAHPNSVPFVLPSAPPDEKSATPPPASTPNAALAAPPPAPPSNPIPPVPPPDAGITRWDLYEDGLMGGEHSAARRAALLRSLGLPARLSTSRMLQVFNRTLTKEAYRQAVEALEALPPPEKDGFLLPVDRT